MRGEQRSASRRCAARWGPSPRARGAVIRVVGVDGGHGTIPACAGSSSTQLSRLPGARDHPRVRGEQIRSVRVSPPPSGPSPRARGAALPGALVLQHHGTIPACAGSSGERHRVTPSAGDHPRVRGEQRRRLACLPVHWGPSPRARGADRRMVRRPTPRGTIPACAGSRVSGGGGLTVSGDHPRVRGEQTLDDNPGLPDGGPSPRARGAGHRHSAGPRPVGTIPACAGSRAQVRARAAEGRDHPRVRGEQIRHLALCPLSSGPSPRARGAVRGSTPSSDSSGTIPACAGSSRRAHWGSRS